MSSSPYAGWTRPAASDLRILLIDAQEARRRSFAERLEADDCQVRAAAGAADMYAALGERSWSAVVLDAAPAGHEGRVLLQDLLAAPGRPAVILLNSPDDIAERLIALELGADDVMAHPANPRELQARIKAVLRSRRYAVTVKVEGWRLIYEFAGYRLDTALEELGCPDGSRTPLPRSEFLLLSALLDRPGRIVSRERLGALSSSGELDSDSRAIDLRVSRLRRRLSAGDGGEIIRTCRGRGYMLSVPVAAY